MVLKVNSNYFPKPYQMSRDGVSLPRYRAKFLILLKSVFPFKKLINKNTCATRQMFEQRTEHFYKKNFNVF